MAPTALTPARSRTWTTRLLRRFRSGAAIGRRDAARNEDGVDAGVVRALDIGEGPIANGKNAGVGNRLA